MTGGQCSPTTPLGKRATTAPYGNAEKGFDPTTLAKAAGASYVARGTVYHVQQMDKLIIGGLEKRGFSMIEAFSNCHTYYGRMNKEGDAVAMIRWMKDHAIPAKTAKNMPPEKLENKFLTGVLWNVEMPEYCTEYQKLIDSFQKEQEG